MDLERHWEFQKISWRVQRVGWLVCFLILCVAGAGFLGGGGFSRRSFHAPGFEIAYESPMRLGVAAEVAISMRYENTLGSVGPEPAVIGSDEVMIGTEFVNNVDNLAVLPTPETTQFTAEGLTLHYPVRPARLRMQFIPASAGFLDLRLTFGGFRSSLRTLVLP